MEEKRTLYVTREFLNSPKIDPTSTGLIVSQVSTEIYKKSEYIGTNNELKISDCNRTISLDIDYDPENDDEYDNIVHKLSVLIKVLRDTLGHVVIQKKEMDAIKSEKQ